IGPAIVQIWGRAALESAEAAGEPEGAARRLEAAALRLEVIQVHVGVVPAEADRVVTVDPSEIQVAHVGVIAEHEGVTGVRVAHGNPPILYVEVGDAALVGAGVGPRDIGYATRSKDRVHVRGGSA